MRLLRVLTAAIGLAALLPRPSAAQEGRQFKDAWFWGIKGGGMLYSSASTEHSVAPSVGAEWLITRIARGPVRELRSGVPVDDRDSSSTAIRTARSTGTWR